MNTFVIVFEIIVATGSLILGGILIWDPESGLIKAGLSLTSASLIFLEIARRVIAAREEKRSIVRGLISFLEKPTRAVSTSETLGSQTQRSCAYIRERDILYSADS